MSGSLDEKFKNSGIKFGGRETLVSSFISFEKLDAKSFLIQDILNENTNERIVNKNLKRTLKKI